MASRRRDYGSLSPRLQELSAKTTPVEPYQVTDEISIEHPGRKRRDELNESYAQITTCNARSAALLSSLNDAPRPPNTPADDATDEQVAEFERLNAEFDALMATWVERMNKFDEKSEQLAADSAAASKRYQQALFGPAYDDIMALSENWDPQLWDDFVADVNAWCGRGVNPPPDGTCRTCGQVVDAEEAGKAPSSST